jgi:D-tyrosyl-tRNA(Tyr) deacylase
MRAVVQRVSEASVVIGGECVARIGHGLLAFVGFHGDDGEADLEYMADKIIGLRVFGDEEGKMNRSLADEGGALLIVSQFTLYGDARKGRRPSYSEAMAPGPAQEWYRRFVALCRTKTSPVEEGVFGADMKVRLANEGPVTLLLDSRRNF